MKKFQPGKFEKNWVSEWEKEHVYDVNLKEHSKEKKYILDMFPYPSGAGLHVGHPRGYTATDILARFYRLNNYTVLHPMGWDAFGLPAENSAIKAKTNPKNIVPKNIKTFKRQLKSLGYSYDWRREFSTTDEEYYRWTQWLFIQFFNLGLLYKKNTPINYCLSCKTGLAEEEVLPNGTHERCGNKITKKDLPQWIFRITKYADVLLQGLNSLEWPKGILEMQQNWIGRKEGVKIKYELETGGYFVWCFTTRPETNFGATFVVVAPEHEIVNLIVTGEIKNSSCNEETIRKIKEYVALSKAKKNRERESDTKVKTGIDTKFTVVNKLNGEKLPLYISDYVLSNFGTGAVVGVPAHDQRDYDFAHHNNIKLRPVIVSNKQGNLPKNNTSDMYDGEGIMINSSFLDGLSTQEAKKVVTEYIENNNIGKKEVSYHLRDWIFSRQRYWGEPIPMVYCENCAANKVSHFKTNGFFKDESINNGFEILNKEKFKQYINEVEEGLYGYFPVEEKLLPVTLPDIENYEPLETGQSPLSRVAEFVNTTCPYCKKPAKRETDTMPNWAGSCWYFLYFARDVDAKAENEAKYANMHNEWSIKLRKNFEAYLPVDWYVGGAEHAVLHLLYSRFFMYAMKDLGLISFDEPFLRLRNVGMILAPDNRKMSKSFGNVINPDDVINEYGADTLRLCEMFMAPFSQEIAWSTRTLAGTYRFLNRVWSLSVEYDSYKTETINTTDEYSNLSQKLAKTIKKVKEDITNIKFNTAIASMMEFLNEWESASKTNKFALKKTELEDFLIALSPFAPFTTEEIWRNVLMHKKSIHLEKWRSEGSIEDSNYCSISVSINGKTRGVINISKDAKDSEALAEAKKLSAVNKHLNNLSIKKIIYVKGKVLSLIV